MKLDLEHTAIDQPSITVLSVAWSKVCLDVRHSSSPHGTVAGLKLTSHGSTLLITIGSHIPSLGWDRQSRASITCNRESNETCAPVGSRLPRCFFGFLEQVIRLSGRELNSATAGLWAASSLEPGEFILTMNELVRHAWSS